MAVATATGSADGDPRVQELRDRLGEIKTRLGELNAEHDGKRMEPGTEAGDEWVRLNEEYEDKEATVKQLVARHERLAQISGNEGNREAGATFQTRRPDVVRGDDIYDTSTVRLRASSEEGMVLEYQDRAKRAVEQASFPHERAKDKAGVEAHIERTMHRVQGESQSGAFSRHLLHTGSPAYRRAFWKTMAGKPCSHDEQRALSLAGSGGGFAIPFALDPTIIPTSNSVVNPTRAISRIEQIVGSNTWQGVSSGAITATRVAEVTEATDNATTLVQPQATVTKAQAFIPFSIEVQEDWGALESEFAKLLQDSKDDEEATAFVTGAGSGVNPQGFVTGTTATVAAATGLTVTAANLYALEAALPPRFRPNESFVANRGIYNIIRGIDTAGGAALWLYVAEGLVTQSPTPGNTGATLLGRGAWEASAMQATVVNATKLMVVGDFSYFLIVDRIGMTVELVPHIFGATSRYPIGQRGLYAYWRNTSKVLSASAFVALTGTT